MSLEIEGVLHVKFDTQAKTQTFRTREFIVEYAENPMYPQYIKFQLTQDKCDDLDQYSVGSKIKVQFNLRGREWVDSNGISKYFTSLEAWRISVLSETVEPLPAKPEFDLENLPQDSDDDLPF